MTELKPQSAPSHRDVPVDFEPMDRSAFLLKGALAVGAVYGAASVGPLVSRALSQFVQSDVDILNFAYTLELLEADFYDQALKNVNLSSEYRRFAEEVGSNEQDHVTALKGAIEKLDGEVASSPAFEFPMKSESDFVDLAITFEDTGVSAYNGAGPMLKNKDFLAVAGSIVQIEGRHAGAIRFMAGQQPVVEAFDATMSEDEVLSAVMPFFKS